MTNSSAWEDAFEARLSLILWFSNDPAKLSALKWSQAERFCSEDCRHLRVLSTVEMWIYHLISGDWTPTATNRTDCGAINSEGGKWTCEGLLRGQRKLGWRIGVFHVHTLLLSPFFDNKVFGQILTLEGCKSQSKWRSLPCFSFMESATGVN